MKNKKNKGFTLAELLVVVAIIGVLVAIGIPTFSGILSKTRKATCEANRRSLLADISVKYMSEDSDLKLNQSIIADKEYTCPEGGTIRYTINSETGLIETTCSYHQPFATGSVPSIVNCIVTSLKNSNKDPYSGTLMYNASSSTGVGSLMGIDGSVSKSLTEAGFSLQEMGIQSYTYSGGSIKMTTADTATVDTKQFSDGKVPFIYYNSSNGQYVVGRSNLQNGCLPYDIQNSSAKKTYSSVNEAIEQYNKLVDGTSVPKIKG